MVEKNMGYFEDLRSDVFLMLGDRKFDRALDVGCGAGVTSGYLKQSGIVKNVIGIEFVAEQAAKAREVLNQVHVLDLNSNDTLPLDNEKFDLILCLDVLEHLVDPWTFLQTIRTKLAANGILVASLPNIRHFRTSLNLVCKGDWNYTDAGTLDRTHLRFFTKKTSRSLFESSGFTVDALLASKKTEGPKARFLKAISFGLLNELLDFQYLVKASSHK